MVSSPPPGRGIISRWAAKMAEELRAPIFQRDRAFLERLLPLMEIWGRYFDAEVRGVERLPSGPVLLVGNHSGGSLTPDTAALIAAWYRARGLDDPLLLLGADPVFAIPGFKTLVRKVGLIPASHGNAERALAQGASVLVYPGGAHEAYRPWRDRNRLAFDGRHGFVRLALRAGVPVVPVVGHGGHETHLVLTRGEPIARRMGMDRLRLTIFPIFLQFPWGISTPATPGIPLPAKITVEIGEPIHWSALGPAAADDPEVVQRCADEVTARMQETLTRLARARPHPLWDRFAGLGRRGR